MKKIVWIVLGIILIALGILSKYLIDRSLIFTGFAAKNVASGIFIANRTQKSIEDLDIHFFPVNLANTKVDTINKIVESDFFGFNKQTAIYRKGLGVCLLSEGYEVTEQQKQFLPSDTNTIINKEWPYGDVVTNDVSSLFNQDSLQSILEWALKTANTRAVIIAYDTLGIIEKYQSNFNKDTKLLGWSMSKSIISSLVGILVQQNKLQLNAPAPLKEWANDERKNISLRSLLTMSSGLEWDEDYGDISDVTLMLYANGSKSAYAIQKKTEFPVDSIWEYSSGTSNILSEIVKRQFDKQDDYWNFPYQALFNRIGMHHTIMEADISGNFVASSYTYATARDWTRFGLLYLKNGIWGKDTILSPEWVQFTKTEAPHSKGKYGAQFWINQSGYELPNAPRGIFYADGYQGQRIYIIPSKKLVITRFGISKKGEFDYDKLVTGIINAMQ